MGFGTLLRREHGHGKGDAPLSHWVPPRFKVEGLLPLSRRLLPLVEPDRPPSTFPAIPTPPFSAGGVRGHFPGSGVAAPVAGEIFHFSPGSVFCHVLVLTQAGSPLGDGDRWGERRQTSASHCCFGDGPSGVLSTNLSHPTPVPVPSPVWLSGVDVGSRRGPSWGRPL